MATVTGFTAERMLTIENETVVDGEVRDTNLFLIRRDGIEIDAGWVKGAPGGMGAQGPPGVIQSINDEVNPIAYSPRAFNSKAELDAWVNAPYGSVGVVRDGSQTIWQKDTIGWFLVNGMRIFTSVAERDSRWLNPPEGSICQAPVGTEYRYIGGVWVAWLDNVLKNTAHGFVASAIGPATTQDIGAYAWDLFGVTWIQKAGRRYKIEARVVWTQVTAAATSSTWDVRNDGIPYRETFWNQGSPLTYQSVHESSGITTFPVTSSDRSVAVTICGGGGPGASRLGANMSRLSVYDVGPG
jgi:hypothetical protein